jgi:hypothetical protein
MQTEMMSTGQLSRILQIPRHKLEYKIATGNLAEPKTRFLGKRVFSRAEAWKIAQYFGKENEFFASNAAS